MIVWWCMVGYDVMYDVMRCMLKCDSVVVYGRVWCNAMYGEV